MSKSSDEDLWSERRSNLNRHITNVRDSCALLGGRLIRLGETKLGHNLIANGWIHDNSKWFGIEWEFLHSDLMDEETPLLAVAVKQHTKTNRHHPEYWDNEEGDGIIYMPRLYLAEMVCDWHARSHEFGNDVLEWIKTNGTKKFKFTVQSKPYKEIKDLLGILLDTKFKAV